MELSQVTNAYIDSLKTIPNPGVKIPEQEADSFEKSKEINEVPLNTYKAPLRCNISFSAGKTAFITLSSAAVIAGVMGALLKGKTNEIGNLQSMLAGANGNVQKLESQLAASGGNVQKLEDQLAQTKKDNSAAIDALNETIKTLKRKIDTLSESDENFEALKKQNIARYQEIADNAKLSYDPLLPNSKVKAEGAKRSFKKLFPFEDCSQEITPKKKNNFVQDLIAKFKRGEDIEISPVKKPNSRKAISEASLDNAAKKQFMRIGETDSSHIALNYGTNSTNWSNEKISRDIMQNFYDANGYTLDGVGLSVKKGLNGYTVRVEGNGVYDVSSLLEMGSGNKLGESPYNAGGFGEGSRIVATNLLAKNKTKNIRYASADWIKDFSAQDGSLVERIDKAKGVLDGNYVEFTTEDKGLVESLIKSMNFFKHSNNPDFQGLNFENPSFGFKILRPNEKGNLYMTQRFEFGKSGAWDDSMDGLSLIFKRKPDSEEFEKLTGKIFNTGRDREYFTSEDVYDLTKYFARDMSDEELVKAISETKAHWNITEFGESQKAMKSFIEALLESANNRGLGIDFSKDKICQLNRFHNDKAVVQHVQGMGYKVLPNELSLGKVGMPSISDISQLSSTHKAIEPTEVEVKKLKLLEEATKVIQEGMDKTSATQLQDIYRNARKCIRIDDLFDVNDILYKIEKSSFKECEFAKKYSGLRSSGQNIDAEEFTRDLIAFLDKEMASIGTDDIKKADELTKITLKALSKNPERYSNGLVSQTETSLENLRLITPEDVAKPRYVFDRTKEISKNTLGEAIISGEYTKQYDGHWIDKGHLDEASFHELISTWLHEISHKSGGDGTAAFTYKLTDLIASLTNTFTNNPETRANLSAIEAVYNNL
ncbi:MAG: hypothetical protein LUE64_02095 [Candidatus Gastranaerophilales bacterium]|nr:hypothetical protein [Candidatus Gastranaerophilales bacterium]